jgi:hypothetical protein
LAPNALGFHRIKEQEQPITRQANQFSACRESWGDGAGEAIEALVIEALLSDGLRRRGH